MEENSGVGIIYQFSVKCAYIIVIKHKCSGNMHKYNMKEKGYVR